jgi:hypothetical protein
LVHPSASAEHIFTYFLQSTLFLAGSSSAADDECRFLSGFLLDFCLIVADAATVLEFSDVFGVEVVSPSDGDGPEADKVSFILILSAAAALACAVLLDL